MTVLLAAMAGWWLVTMDRVGYEHVQRDPSTACQSIPMQAPVTGGPDIADAMKIESSGEIFDCSSNDPSRCWQYKGYVVDFATGKVTSTTDSTCDAKLEVIPNGNLHYSGGCKGENDSVELFSITEEGYRKYVEVAHRCPKN